MNLDRAQKCASHLVEWLTPLCTRVEVAGSIRRGKAQCSDIDLVMIPQTGDEKDIFGKVMRRENLTWKAIDARATADRWKVIRAGAEIVSLTAKDVQVDIFWAEPHTWGTILLCRTGSKEHNIWLSQRAQLAGGKWHPPIGLYLHNKKYSATEEEIYDALGLDWIQPEKRESHLLIHAGLCRPCPTLAR